MLYVTVFQEKVYLENYILLLNFNRDILEKVYENLESVMKMGHFAHSKYIWPTNFGKKLLHFCWIKNLWQEKKTRSLVI